MTRKYLIWYHCSCQCICEKLNAKKTLDGIVGAPVCQLIQADSKQVGPVDDWLNLHSAFSAGCQ